MFFLKVEEYIYIHIYEEYIYYIYMSLSTYQASVFPTILCLQLTLIILDTYEKEKFFLWRSANSNSDFLPLI